MNARSGLRLVPPDPIGSFETARQMMLVRFHNMVDLGYPASDLLAEAESTANAMRQLVELLRG